MWVSGAGESASRSGKLWGVGDEVLSRRAETIERLDVRALGPSGVAQPWSDL